MSTTEHLLSQGVGAATATETVGLPSYIVLRNLPGAPDGQQWEIVNYGVDARSAEAAIRADLADAEKPAGVYVAIPARSWKPVTVKAETTTVLKLEAAG